MEAGSVLITCATIIGLVVVYFLSNKKRFVVVHVVKQPGKETRISTKHFSLKMDAVEYKISVENELGVHENGDNRFIDRIERISQRETIVVINGDLHHLKIEKVK